MRTQIMIGDCGCQTTAEHDGKNLQVLSSGGCPVVRLLSGINFRRRNLDAIAVDVLAAWKVGYDGNPAENKLFVSITRGLICGTAIA